MDAGYTFWNAPDDECAGQALIALMGETDARNSIMRTNTRRLVRAYELGSEGVENDATKEAALDEEVTAFNFARNIIETMASKICKARISPMTLSEGGGYLARARAREADQALEGVFEENGVDEIKERIIADSLVTDHGAGFAKVYERDGDIVIEHVPVEDIRFDSREIRRGRPRSVFQEHDMDKWELAELYPAHRGAILSAAGSSERTGDNSSTPLVGKDRVIVYEGWHLRSGKEAKDGRHVMAINGATLVNEAFDDETWPFAAYVPRKKMRSVWGLSVMRDLAPAQREIDEMTQGFQRAHRNMGMSGWMGRKGSVNPSEVVGDYGIFLEWDGPEMPTPFTAQPVHPDQYAYRDTLVRDMGNSVGVSQLSTTSQLPAGLQQASGKALQVFEDFESERLLPFHRELERWTIQVSWLVMRLAKRLCDRGDNPKTRYVDKSGWREVEWAKIVKDLDAYVIRVFPVSSLAKQPAARFAQLQELLSAGAITVEQFKRLYDIPDLETEMELDTADTDIIDKMLEQIVLESKSFTPEPFDDLELLIPRASKYYNLCRVKDVPEGAMQRLREFITAAKAMKDRLAAEAAAKVAASAPPPGPGLASLPPVLPGVPQLPPDGGVPPMMPPVAA